MKFSKFLGMNNIVSWERQSPVGAKGEEPAHYLDSSSNVYLDDSGRIALRDGYTTVVAGAAHSLWADGDIGLYANGGGLRRLWSDYTSTLLRSDLSGAPVSYQEAGGLIYYSDGIITGIYSQDSTVMDWGVSEPQILAPTITSGNLPAGRYGYVATIHDQLGREGGAINFSTIELSEGGGLRFDITNEMIGDNLQLSIYATPANGDVYYLIGSTFQAGALNYLDEELLVLPLDTAHLGRPPAGHIVAHYRGRMLVANDQWLFYSEPYRYHLFKADGYLPVGERATIVAPVEDGIWVATQSKTYFLGGDDPEKFVLRTVAHHGAIEGTLLYTEAENIGGLDKVPSQPMAIWSTPEGIVAGGNGGLFVNLTESHYKFDEVSDRGASVITKMGGSNQFITTIL